MHLLGLHHLTAISANISQNHRFYTGTMGMRLVKKSVNQDDVSAYHLFYADGIASPGTDITFFDFPVPPERRGTRSITRTGLRVAGRPALDFWVARFARLGVRHGEIAERDSRLTLDFEDFEGQRLSLIDDNGQGTAHQWVKSPVPEQFQIRGLGPIIMSVPDLKQTDVFLREVMNMRAVRSYGTPGNSGSQTQVYEMGPGGAAAELHVAVEPGLPVAQQGAGAVHHVAFNIADADYQAWAERLAKMRQPNSGPVNRYYFRSLYFREPGGILFELATEGPGFGLDEDMETLGERLALPPFLEARRAEIERNLKPL